MATLEKRTASCLKSTSLQPLSLQGRSPLDVQCAEPPGFADGPSPQTWICVPNHLRSFMSCQISRVPAHTCQTHISVTGLSNL